MRTRWIAAIERRPWLVAIVAASGATLLVPSALALFAPPDLLDAAISLGDRRLALSLLVWFAAATCLFRLWFRRRASAEEEVEDDGIAQVPPVRMNTTSARRVEEEELGAGQARSYLR